MMRAQLHLSSAILLTLLIAVNCSDYDECGKVNLDPTQFAIDGNGFKLFAPWIVALGVKKDEDKDGFVELKVVCSGSMECVLTWFALSQFAIFIATSHPQTR